MYVMFSLVGGCIPPPLNLPVLQPKFFLNALKKIFKWRKNLFFLKNRKNKYVTKSPTIQTTRLRSIASDALIDFKGAMFTNN